MVEKIKYTLANNPKAVLLAALILLLAIVALYMNLDMLPDLWPSEKLIKQRLTELKQVQEKLRLQVEKKQHLAEIIANSSADNTRYWIPSRDGDPKLAMRKIVENASAKTGLKLSALGALRTSELDGGLMAYEMNLSSLGDFELMLKFLQELEHSKPKLYWSQFSFRPDNTRKPKNVYFNGTVKAVVIESEKTITMLLGETP